MAFEGTGGGTAKCDEFVDDDTLVCLVWTVGLAEGGAAESPNKSGIKLAEVGLESLTRDFFTWANGVDSLLTRGGGVDVAAGADDEGDSVSREAGSGTC